uniref:VWFA domain-containing protein n=1 Tax=Eptatretus burgeri TaxID=7764 RepID=A0A8C4QLM6_EPTBU
MDDSKVSTLAAFKQAVKKLEWIAGGTWTPSALKYAYDILVKTGKRAGVLVSAIVITDGRYDPRDKDDNLQALCNAGVNVNAIGIGDMFQRQQDTDTLKSITCGKSENIHGMSQFADLVAEDTINKIEKQICPGNQPPTICLNVKLHEHDIPWNVWQHLIRIVCFVVAEPKYICPEMSCGPGK